MLFFTSDFHINHFNIIRYSARPYSSVEEMNESLVENFNKTVSSEDLTYHLGDFSLDERMVPLYLPRLNGKHVLICGNHDACHPRRKGWKRQTNKYISYGFQEVQVRKVIFVDRLGDVLLTHMPRSDYEDPRYEQYRPNDWKGWIFCGHVHEKWKIKENQINVGVDQWNYKPVSLEEIVDSIGRMEHFVII